MKPKISIVIPVLNSARFIDAAIRSVLDQGYPNLELIVIDGGSTDGTAEIIRSFAERLAYWQSSKDRGQVDALNAGFAHATGDIRGWLNADEEYLPGTLQSVADALPPNPHRVLIYGDRTVLDVSRPDARPVEVRVPSLRPLDLMLYTGRILFTDASFWTRDIQEAIGILDERYQRYAMDVDWLLRVCGEARTAIRIPRPLSIFKEHGQRMTHEGESRGVRLNEVIRLRYIQAKNIPKLQLTAGWLYYSTRLRFEEHGVLGALAPPKWSTISELLFKRV